MEKATRTQIGAIYGIGTKCGLYEQGNRQDDLHAVIYQLTDKSSIAELTSSEADRVINHLHGLSKELAAGDATTPGAITPYQIKKVFGLMYELQSLDAEQSQASVKQRLVGIMQKLFGEKLDPRRDIFKGISQEQGDRLIEEIKRYVRNSKRKTKGGKT